MPSHRKYEGVSEVQAGFTPSEYKVTSENKHGWPVGASSHGVTQVYRQRGCGQAIMNMQPLGHVVNFQLKKSLPFSVRSKAALLLCG